MKIHIETQRLLIREIRNEDAQGIFELDSDPEIHRYLGNNPITTMEQAKAVVQFIQQQYTENGIGRFAVTDKRTGGFMGWTGLKWINEKINNHIHYHDLGYRLIRKYWGQGYATETAKAGLAYGFDRMKLNEIYAIADVRNGASNAILQKIGLQLIETFDYNNQAHNWYKLSKKEWVMQQK